MLKKIDDEDERKEVMLYFKGRLPKSKDQLWKESNDKFIKLPMEEQLVDATDSFVKHIFSLFFNVLVIAVGVLLACHFTGLIDVF